MSFDSKKNCWICLKPYDDHTDKDWEKCTKANTERGKAISTLETILKKSGHKTLETKGNVE